MPQDGLRYDAMVEEALRGVVRAALAEAARTGLPGNHHFYVTFRTGHPGVELPARLLERYPQEMTVVLQHRFWDLGVEPERFSVTLSFNDIAERLVIPFAAITAFADPSVRFGLQFGAAAEEDRAAPSAQPKAEAPPKAAADAPAPEERPAEKVVTLDQFRRKP